MTTSRQITILPAALPVKCPQCGGLIPWRRVNAVGFPCGECQTTFRIRPIYCRTLYLLSGLFSAVGSYVLGVRSDAWFATTMLGWWPTYFVVLLVTLRVVPPDLEPTGEYHSILYGDLAVRDSRTVSEPIQPTPRAERSHVQSRSSMRMFQHVGGGRPVEELVFTMLALVLVGFGLWQALTPVIYRIAPEVGANYSGPATFPVQLHIGRAALTVTNGSSAYWTCEIALGIWPAYSITALVEPKQSADLAYSAFTRSADDRGLSPERAAREQIDLRCAEPGGVIHFWRTR